MKQKTYYHIILDQSGSMQDCLQPTISGFNEQLQVICSLQQRFPEQEVLVGLTRFNDQVMHTYYAQQPHFVAPLTKAIYIPNGTTALYDAIGLSVREIRKQVDQEIEHGIAAAIVVIITDGYENASQSFSHKQVKSLIGELEANGKWTFSYLGATLDAQKIAESLNISRDNSMYFHKTHVKETFDSLGFSMNSYMEKRRDGKSLSSFLKRKD